LAGGNTLTMKFQISNFKFQINLDKGQVVIILVLITVVGLTIGLSLISRTITDIRISSQIEQSGKALSAAEAGIESALKGAVVGGPTGTVNLPDATATYNVQSLGGVSSVYTIPLTEVGRTHTIWLIAHNEDGTINESDPNAFGANKELDVCWGSNVSNTAALVMSIFYKHTPDNTYKVAKTAYDPLGRGNFNIVLDQDGGNCNGNYQFRQRILPITDFGLDPIPSNSKLLALRLVPLYQSTIMALLPFDPLDLLPVQGKLITSVGQTSSGVLRKIYVNQGYRVLPSLLDFTLFTEE